LGEPGNGKVGAILAFPGAHGLTLDFGKVLLVHIASTCVVPESHIGLSVMALVA
jgi:hypothetical protein